MEKSSMTYTEPKTYDPVTFSQKAKSETFFAALSSLIHNANSVSPWPSHWWSNYLFNNVQTVVLVPNSNLFRSQLQQMYNADQSLMSFEGQQMQGAVKIMEKIQAGEMSFCFF